MGHHDEEFSEMDFKNYFELGSRATVIINVQYELGKGK